MAKDWHFAVVVGIDQYPDLDDGALDLKCPLRDAQQVADWLGSPQGGDLPPAQIKLITRTFPAITTRLPPVPLQEEIYRAVRDTVREFVAARKKLGGAVAQKQAWEQSRFYFYISGHGIDAAGDDTVVITASASRDYLGVHISTRGLWNALKQADVFAELVVVADACREFSYTAIAPPPFNFEPYRGFRSDHGTRSFYASASRTRKKAYEPPDGCGIANSFFTYALLQGLQGGVVGGRVTSEKLKHYLLNAVPALTRKYLNVEQHPEIEDDPGIEFVSAPVKKQRVRLHIGSGSSFAGVADLDALVYADGAVKARYPMTAAGGGVYEIDLEGGSYLVVPRDADPTDPGIPFQPVTVLGVPIDDELR